MAEGGKGEATKAMGDEEGQGRARGRQGDDRGGTKGGSPQAVTREGARLVWLEYFVTFRVLRLSPAVDLWFSFALQTRVFCNLIRKKFVMICRLYDGGDNDVMIMMMMMTAKTTAH